MRRVVVFGAGYSCFSVGQAEDTLRFLASLAIAVVFCARRSVRCSASLATLSVHKHLSSHGLFNVSGVACWSVGRFGLVSLSGQGALRSVRRLTAERSEGARTPPTQTVDDTPVIRRGGQRTLACGGARGCHGRPVVLWPPLLITPRMAPCRTPPPLPASSRHVAWREQPREQKLKKPLNQSLELAPQPVCSSNKKSQEPGARIALLAPGFFIRSSAAC